MVYDEESVFTCELAKDDSIITFKLVGYDSEKESFEAIY